MRIIKIVIVMGLVTGVAVGLQSFAAEVSQNKARLAAKTWISQGKMRPAVSFGGSEDILDSKTVFDDAGRSLCHLFGTKGGFVVMSADTMLPPVIAFSPNGRIDLEDCRNPLVAFLLEDMRRRMGNIVPDIRFRQKTQTSSSTACVCHGGDQGFGDEWDKLLDNSACGTDKKVKLSRKEISDVRVSPLVQAQWGQGEWNGLRTFNYYTPSNYVCGCVATAVAQVMRHWREPTQPVPCDTYMCWVDGCKTEKTLLGGTYNWEYMPLASDLCDNEYQRESIGHLLYDVGVASQMQWSSNGSGTWGVAAAKGLRESFGYASAAAYILPKPLRKNISTNNGVRNAILGSLDAGMPVVIGISNIHEGHEVVVDGYGYCGDSLVYCHVNCGWDGSSQDVWYNLIGEPLTQPYGFAQLDDVVYNIHPFETGSVVSGRVLDKDGVVVAGATIRIASEEHGVQETYANDNGIYAFRVASGGKFAVSAEKGNLASSVRETTVNSCVDTQWSITDDGYLSYSTSGKAAGTLGNVWGVDLTLYPKKTIYCIVKFEANGGYVSETVRHVAKGAEVGALPVPEMENMVFDGWRTARDGGDLVQAGDIINDDVTFYADWRAQQVEWDFVVEGDSAIVTGVTGAKGELIIPDSLGGLSVRSIGKMAFECCDALTKIKVADSVTNIEERAFFSCRGITSVELPGSLLNVGVAAFEDCTSLNRLWLPPSVEHVAPRAFKGCRRLNEAYVPDALKDRIGEGSADYVFDGCNGVLNVIYYNPDKLYSIRFRRNDGTDLCREAMFVYGEKMRMPALKNGLNWTRPNYEFLGWATSLANVNSRKIWKKDWAYVATPTNPGKMLNAYATWDVVPSCAYTIVFNKNDGSGQSRSVRFMYGEKTRLPAVANGLGWSRPGYRFLGWATGSKIWKQDWAYVERPVGIGKTLTVYAVWGK